MLNILDQWGKMSRVMISAVEVKARDDRKWKNVLSVVVS
jgi:hypothetical protein